MIAGGPIRDK